MADEVKGSLTQKIMAALKISSQKLIEKKRALGQTIVISENGVIKEIKP